VFIPEFGPSIGLSLHFRLFAKHFLWVPNIRADSLRYASVD